MLNWITIDEMYLDHLRNNVDKRIPEVNYGVDHYKPFFGVLFVSDQFAYVTQVSHPQPRHTTMKSGQDFVKVFDGKKLLCVVNLNYMFPVPNSSINYLNYGDIHSYRTFNSEKEKNDYIALLKKEMTIMQTMGIESKAKNLYKLWHDHPEAPVAQRCLNFSALENECSSYYSLD